MNRRAFLNGMISASIGAAAKAQQCVAIGPGAVGCHAEINFPSVRVAYEYQQCPEWCWAASISMVFRFFGHPLDQKRIVIENYGSLVCAPSGTASRIAANLNRSWAGDDGRPFTSQLTTVYDARAGVVAINNAFIVNEIVNQRPILYCNTHHAMVIIAVDYRPTQLGPQIDRVIVMDPWPLSPQIHPSSAPEMLPPQMRGQMTFLATVRVS